MIKVVVLVPRRADSGHRDNLWAFARAWWLEQHPDWPLYEGEHACGPFNRAAAINQAAAGAGDWDVAIVLDADVIVNPQAVTTAIDVAHATGQMVVPHHERVMLNRNGTQRVINGYRGSWRFRQMIECVYTDSVSCAIAIPRAVWDLVGGFDELFVGWGFEDTAFHLAAETLTGRPIIRLASELFHLWHPMSPDASRHAATYRMNLLRRDRYREAWGDREKVNVLLREARGEAPGPLPMANDIRIPRILHRTVPATTTPEIEIWWDRFRELHPGWTFLTYREPLDSVHWPITGAYWHLCQNGAQKAGLIRLEALFTHGGVYVDADVEPFRSFEPLLHLRAFAAWEDETTIPDAVMGAEPEHPAVHEMLQSAMTAVRHGRDAWTSGPGVTTSTLPGRSDVLLLPPGAFYPHHYLEKSQAGARTANPWVFCEHKWQYSWGTPQMRQAMAQNQR